MTTQPSVPTASPDAFRRSLGRGLAVIGGAAALGFLAALVEAALSGGWAMTAPAGAVAGAVAWFARDIWRKSGGLLDMTARFREAALNRQALDHSTANIMIADPRLDIVYVMPALECSLARSADYWSRQPEPVDARDLVGKNIDVFHENPGRIRTMLSSMTEPYATRISFDGRTFGLHATPIFDESGARSGYVVEWTEKTEELAKATRITEVIEAVAAGDFSQTLPDSLATPETRGMIDGLNRICRIVDGYFGRLADSLGALAEGDLTRRMPMEGEGRFRELAEDVNSTLDRLGALIADVKHTGRSLGGSTRQIADSSGDLSARAESQAASLEQTAATMHEMASTVRSNADNAERSAATAREASGQVGAGRQIVTEAVAAMDRIEKSAARISEITALIDSIAFQTNLLALNASVEAARAGEAGKGFAVVASEVRLLAQRSAEAARDIKTLIAESSGAVAEGVDLVQRTGAALERLSEGIADVAAKVEDITAATREQSAGVEEISAAVTRMDELTQQNAALAEESAGAARALDGQAERLFELVAAFRTEADPAARATAAE